MLKQFKGQMKKTREGKKQIERTVRVDSLPALTPD